MDHIHVKNAVFRDVTPCGLVIIRYKMRPAGSSETLVSIWQVKHRHMPKDHILQIRRHETSNFIWFILAHDRI